jgi:hypothetical protein
MGCEATEPRVKRRGANVVPKLSNDPFFAKKKGTPMVLSRCGMVGEAFLRAKIGTVSPLRSRVPSVSAQRRR